MTFEEYSEVLTQDKREGIVNDVVAEMFPELVKRRENDEN